MRHTLSKMVYYAWMRKIKLNLLHSFRWIHINDCFGIAQINLEQAMGESFLSVTASFPYTLRISSLSLRLSYAFFSKGARIYNVIQIFTKQNIHWHIPSNITIQYHGQVTRWGHKKIPSKSTKHQKNLLVNSISNTNIFNSDLHISETWFIYIYA